MLISVDQEFSDFCYSFKRHNILNSLKHIYAVVSNVLCQCSRYNIFYLHFYRIIPGLITLFVYTTCVFLSSQRRAGSLTQVQSQLGTHILAPKSKATLLLYAVFTFLPSRL